MPLSLIQQPSLASGVPSATNITTGTLPRAQLPAGSVLQVINRQLNGTTQTVSNTSGARTQLTGWSQSITKIRSNSRILCHITFYNYITSQAGGGWWGLQAQVGGSAVTGQPGAGNFIFSHNVMQYSFAQSAHQGWTCLFYDERDQTNITYDFFHQSTGVIDMVWWNNGVTWTFIEVAV